MSWEPFERWPGEDAGGAFRGASEPRIAERRGLTVGDRVRLFLADRPDLPAARVAERVALSARHVYVERRDGSRERVARARLEGARRDGPLLVVGVADGEDLFLPSREREPVQERLVEQLGIAEPLRIARGQVATLLGSVSLAAFGVALLQSYPLRQVVEHARAGLWTSESSLGFHGGVLALALAALLVLWAPSLTTIDRTGVERRRGLFRAWVSRRPPEDFSAVAVLPHRGKRGKYGSVTTVAYSARVRLRREGRLGSLTRVRHVELRWVYAPEAADLARARAEASLIAQRAATLLGLPVESDP